MPLILEPNGASACHTSRTRWYDACRTVSEELADSVPVWYRTRTFSGILGDIKALSSKKALSLFSRKKGLGKQYALLYLGQGIDDGKGYQSCTAEALSSLLSSGCSPNLSGRILDVGCAVGVTAGVLELSRIIGFDLFGDLVSAAQSIDIITGAGNEYAVADMTKEWPFADAVFNTVFCGLVCHHLKDPHEIVVFFSSANRVLTSGGRLIITLPSGSIATTAMIHSLIGALDDFGFDCDRDRTGMLVSADSEHSLFWAFVICVEKKTKPQSHVFIDRAFGFHQFRTPVTRVEKGDKARVTVESERSVKHERFLFFPIDELSITETPTLVYDTVAELARSYG